MLAFVNFTSTSLGFLRSCRRKPDEVDVKFTKASITSYQDSERYRTSLLNMTGSDINIHADMKYIVFGPKNQNGQGPQKQVKTSESFHKFRCKVNLFFIIINKYSCLDDAKSVHCDSWEPQAMAHLLSCRLLDEACTADDQTTVTERAKACARKWEKIV